MELTPDGVIVELASVGGIPAYDDDARANRMPGKVATLQSKIAVADAVIIATPEYNYLDAHVLNRPEVMIGAAHTRFDDGGRLPDEATRNFLKVMIAALRD